MGDYRGKSILIVGGGLLQVPAVQIARDMGLYVICTDRNPEAPAMKLADRAIALDTKDIEGHKRLARQLKGEGLAAVFTEGASVEQTVAGAAQVADLPGLNPNVAYQIATKHAMRVVLEQARIPQPRFAYLWPGMEDCEVAINHVGFPMVVKSDDNSGSRGLSKVYERKGLTDAVIKQAQKHSSNAVVLLEELLQPVADEVAEQSVETVWYEGKGYWLNWVDRPFAPDPRYAVELGHVNPAMHDADTQVAVEHLALEAGRVLGMTTGIFKADVMLTTNGPRILETTARLSGGFDSQYTSPLAHGVNYIRGAIKLSLGEGIDWNDFLPRQYNHSVAWAKLPHPGKITGISGIEDAYEVAGVKHIFCRMNVGDLVGEYTSCVERPLFVISQANTREKALDAAITACQTVRIETEGL